MGRDRGFLLSLGSGKVKMDRAVAVGGTAIFKLPKGNGAGGMMSKWRSCRGSGLSSVENQHVRLPSNMKLGCRESHGPWAMNQAGV